LGACRQLFFRVDSLNAPGLASSVLHISTRAFASFLCAGLSHRGVDSPVKYSAIDFGEYCREYIVSSNDALHDVGWGEVSSNVSLSSRIVNSSREHCMLNARLHLILIFRSSRWVLREIGWWWRWLGVRWLGLVGRYECLMNGWVLCLVGVCYRSH
jgi:hypothetical protein